jgi:molecular chaperone HscA
MHISIDSLITPCAPGIQEAVGIDFGTTNCVVALCEDGHESLILYHNQKSLIASQVHDENQVIRSIKRKLAQLSVEDPLSQTYLAYAVTLFKEISQHIHAVLGRFIWSAVITVPAYFDDVQRSNIRRAAVAAGFNVLRLLSEPTAAALTYGITQDAEGIFAVYDWGGGTFDFSILEIKHGIFKVLATGGDAFLGGDDLDECIAQHMTSQWDTFTADQRQALILKAKQIKEMLCKGEAECVEGVSLQDLRTWCWPLFQKTVTVFQDTLDRIQLLPASIQKLILVGGTTRMPFILEALSEIWNMSVDRTLNPEYAVAQGAAQYAYQLTHEYSFLLLDISPLTIGIEVLGGIVESIIPRGTPLPSSSTYFFTTACDGQTKIQFHVVQGEKEFAQDCKSLGTFELSGVAPLPKGMARIELTCALTVDGLLALTAKDVTTPNALHTPARLQINALKNLDNQRIQEELHSLSQEDGSDMLRRVYTQKRQQGLDILEHVERILHHTPQLFTSEELEQLTRHCLEFRTYVIHGAQGIDALMIMEISKRAETFSTEVLPYIERHLTYILQQNFNPS